VEGNISDTEFGESISFLIEQNILRVEMPDDGEWKAEADKLYKENKKLEAENKKLKQENAELQAILNSVLVETDRNSYLGLFFQTLIYQSLRFFLPLCFFQTLVPITVKLVHKADYVIFSAIPFYDSQPIPSLSLSNP